MFNKTGNSCLCLPLKAWLSARDCLACGPRTPVKSASTHRTGRLAGHHGSTSYSPLAARLSLSRARLGSRSVADTSAPSLPITTPATESAKRAKHTHPDTPRTSSDVQSPLRHISLCQSGVGEASIQVSALSASSMCMIPDSNALWTVNLAGRHTYQATSCTQVQAALAPELCSMHLKVPCHDYAAIPHCIASHASSFIEQRFPKLPWELQVSKSGQMARDNTFLPLHH